jgi:tetratricopeptide (TPR) repeat protein
MSLAALRALVPTLCLLAVALATGPSLRTTNEPSTHAAVYRRTRSAVAWVHAPDQGRGTGWIIDRSRRWLVTNYHVVGEARSVDVFFSCKDGNTTGDDSSYYLENRPQLEKGGFVVRGKVLRRNADVDLALVELESLPATVTELHLAPSDARAGDRFAIVGNRYDCDSLWVHTSGAVRQAVVWKRGYFTGGKQLAKGVHVLLTQAPINEGDSGAPAVNDQGEVIGVAAAVAWEANGGGLLIEASEVQRFVGESARAERTHPVAELNAARDVYQTGLRSFAMVQTEGSETCASGWVVDRSRRFLLTTAAAVGRDQKADVTFPATQNGRVVAEHSFYREQQSLLVKKSHRVSGTVLAVDARRNLALLELPSLPEGVSEARLADRDALPGDALHFLSNPQRLEMLWLYSAGSVRQCGHGNLGQTSEGPDPALLIVQAPLGEGDGGGLVLDERGYVVGMISGKVGPQQQVAFCLPATEIQKFMDEQRPRRDPQTPAELCSRGIVFEKAGRFQRAFEDFDEAIRRDPEFATAYSERGNALRQMGKVNAASDDCDRAIRLDPMLVTAYCHRAEVWLARAQPAKAVADCDTALKCSKSCALAYCVRADAQRQLGELDRAIADCDEAIWHDRRLTSAFLIKGRVLQQQDELAKSIAAYTSALQLDPHLAPGYRLRAEAEWARSDVTAAAADYSEALKIQPDDARSLHGRSRCLAARGEYDAALQDLNAALRSDPHLALALIDRGSEFLRRGDSDRGLKDFSVAIHQQPSVAAGVLAAVERRGLEESKDEKGDLESACMLYRRGLELVKAAPIQKETQKQIDSDLAAAASETDARRRISILREAVFHLKSKLALTQGPESE